jgi:hypothetical protein
VLWGKTFGGAGAEAANAVAVDPSGNVVITGYISEPVDFGGGALTSDGQGQVFVAKFDPTGKYMWSQTYGGVMLATGTAVAVFEEGSVFVTGSFSGNINFGDATLTTMGQTDIFIAKLLTP